ncbi:CAP domain-containing protein [Halorarum salinum]|uniref:CAP domain-containing protein n=1 Tax=Halorarum salinum TaxID=2743089 RepID=A0A7D5Q9Y1_9EURY|nr:CAP domain-containing protein [Halobaculum salinum]QLG62116.1 CAP domain-containing protein [Halobaculum salinum]
MVSRRTVLYVAGSAGVAGWLTREGYVSVDADEPSVSVDAGAVPELDDVVDASRFDRPSDTSPGASPNDGADGRDADEEWSTPSADGDWDPVASGRAAHDEVNERRADAGVAEVAWDDALFGIAQRYAERMAEEEFFSHTDPSGGDFSDRYEDAGYACRVDAGDDGYATGGENLARTWWKRRVRTESGTAVHSTPEELAEGAVEQWMNSTGHRENLLRDYWNNEGIGFDRDDEGKVYAVQNFC